VAVLDETMGFQGTWHGDATLSEAIITQNLDAK
jgi:hypothetical protein